MAISDSETARALSKLREWARREVRGCVVSAADGTPMYTPDGVRNYDALWTRDAAYIAMNAPEEVPLDHLVGWIEMLTAHLREEDGWPPDRVYADGTPVYSAGRAEEPAGLPNLDNAAFLTLMVDACLRRCDAAAAAERFGRWEPALTRALSAVPLDARGLVYNDPASPHSPYGFTDCVGKTGSLMMESLLLWQAFRALVRWRRATGRSAGEAETAAEKIERALVPVFQNREGMLNAATGDCRQTDVWGSCFAVSCGFPLEETVRESIARWMTAHYDEVVQDGQLRHLPGGEYWQRLLCPVRRDEYQNGAYWATASGWLIDTLRISSPDLARRALLDLTRYFDQYGIFECVNGDRRKLPHYVASIVNVLPAARSLATGGAAG